MNINKQTDDKRLSYRTKNENQIKKKDKLYK